MRVKRYVVDSIPEALQRIRTDLGKDAIILDTKPVRTGGFLGLFGKKRIEVIAANDETSKATSSPAAVATAAARETMAVSAAHVPAAAAAARPIHASAAVQAYRQQQPTAVPDPEAVRSDLLVREVRQVKDMLARLTVQGASGATGRWPAAFLPIEERLMEQEVLPDIIREVFERALNEREPADNEWTEREAAAKVRQILLDKLAPDKPRTIRPDTKIVHFVGPTGVGKTTTIAKLAAEQVLRHGRKIGFITADTYRIAAVEQLRTYADILNVPLEVVFSPLEMNKALKALEDRDLIFMDTAGRNYRNEMLVSELNAMLRTGAKSETILVLSLSAKYRDMKTVIDNFSRIGPDNVLYTKLDETDTYGTVLNVAHEYGFRGTYVSDGQNVPDDIAELDERRIIDLIMGGAGDE
jgi:flagellar biosynthesis protein FlhF